MEAEATADLAAPGVDLAALLVRDPACTVLLRVSGPSMQGAGIAHGDLLLLDCGLEPRPGQVVVARLADGFTVKRLVRWHGRLALAAAHPAYPLLPLDPDGDHQLLGVVRHVIRRC
ncbi:MAG: S24 family peptidase [Cyanobacteriota bacterium]|nr:S24 family peptidase [Cyanobacteriota bacterium]